MEGLVAFVFTAYALVILTTFAYFSGFISDGSLMWIDRGIMKATSKRTRSDQAEGFRKVALIFNNQQIVTGIAIMIAAFAQWSSISVYHYQIAVVKQDT